MPSDAIFDGTCRLDRNLRNPVIIAKGLQAQVYTYRFFLDFPPHGDMAPTAGFPNDRQHTFSNELKQAKWNLANFSDFSSSDLVDNLLLIYCNCYIPNKLTQRFTLSIYIEQNGPEGIAKRCPIEGNLWIRNLPSPVESTWEDIVVDFPAEAGTVAFFDFRVRFSA
jgi:hypothetical protein